MKKTAKQYLDELDKEMKETENRLIQLLGTRILNNGGFYFSINEEDGFLEYVLGDSPIKLSEEVKNERLLKLLGYSWSNDRECYPRAFVEDLLNKILDKVKERVKIKQEVKDLCIELRNARDTDSKRFKEIEDILKRKYRFTAYNLLSLWENPPTIEYSNENYDLVMEET